MEELNETGLHHFISLFMSLACVAELEDVVGKRTTDSRFCYNSNNNNNSNNINNNNNSKNKNDSNINVSY